VTGEQVNPGGEERRSEVIMAFLGAGLNDRPSRALMLSALAGARRTIALLQARREPLADWLASETRLRGIRENAATLAAMEVQELRHDTAQVYARDHPDRLGALGDLLSIIA
jgi:hypothetical protein